jgi:hypothetical protein
MIRKWELTTPRPGAHWSPRGFYVWAVWTEPSAIVHALRGPEDHGHEWQLTSHTAGDAFSSHRLAARLVDEL